MADYTVLYHDPLKVSEDGHPEIIAAQAVWVCRDDRYAFEVHVLAHRATDGTEVEIARHGEGRFRLALAILGGQQAFEVARLEPRRSDTAFAIVRVDQVEAIIDRLPSRVSVNFGDVIYRFATRDRSAIATTGSA